jgi:hypothetical protein
MYSIWFTLLHLTHTSYVVYGHRCTAVFFKDVLSLSYVPLNIKLKKAKVKGVKDS